MKKWIKRALLIIVTPFALYYGAMAALVVCWGIADSRVQDSCVEYHMSNGETQEYAREQCWH